MKALFLKVLIGYNVLRIAECERAFKQKENNNQLKNFADGKTKSYIHKKRIEKTF